MTDSQSQAFIEMVRDIVRQLKANPDVIPIAIVPAIITRRNLDKVSTYIGLLNLYI
jgi:hypothetical protein